MDNRKMLYYDRIDVAKGIGANEISESKSVMFVTIAIS